MAEFYSITVRPRQTYFDVAIQEYGGIEGVFDLFEDNPTLDPINIDLTQGVVLQIKTAGSTRTNKDTQDYYRTKQIKVTTGGIIDLPIAELFGEGLAEDHCIDEGAFPLIFIAPGGIPAGPGVIEFEGDWFFDPSTSGLGTFYLTYTLNNTVFRTVIKVHPLPTVTLAAFASVHVSDPPFPLTGGSPAGGFYRVDDIDTVVFDPGFWGIGGHEIAYIYQNEFGCPAQDTKILTVIA